MKLSVLDQIELFDGNSYEATLKDRVKLAQQLEKAGFYRYWISEHHSSTALLSNSPDILITHLLNNTTTIRIGSGGMAVPNYAPLQIVERFLLLETLFPNRVDLGLAKASGSDPQLATLLNHQNTSQNVEQAISEIIHLIRGDTLNQFIKHRPPTLPQLFLLGSSGKSVNTAIKLNTNYAYAHFFSGNQNKHLFEYFHNHTKNIAISCICIFASDTHDKAQKLANSYYYSRIHKFNEPFKKILTPKQLSTINNCNVENLAFVGTYDKVAKMINNFAKEYNCDEIMMITFTENIDTKIKMYKEIAKIINTKID